MGCALGCLALAFPRITLLLVWLLGPTGYLVRPFPEAFWPILGFFFVPTTTLAFAYASNTLASGGEVTPFGWLLTAIALLIDVGIFGGSGRAAHRRRRRDEED